MRQDLIGEIRSIILREGSNQGVVVESYGTEALVAMAGSTSRMATAIAVSVGDTVTVREGRIVAKRSSRADRTYHV